MILWRATNDAPRYTSAAAASRVPVIPGARNLRHKAPRGWACFSGPGLSPTVLIERGSKWRRHFLIGLATSWGVLVLFRGDGIAPDFLISSTFRAPIAWQGVRCLGICTGSSGARLHPEI
jgi:hypothetical protein